MTNSLEPRTLLFLSLVKMMKLSVVKQQRKCPVLNAEPNEIKSKQIHNLMMNLESFRHSSQQRDKDMNGGELFQKIKISMVFIIRVRIGIFFAFFGSNVARSSKNFSRCRSYDMTCNMKNFR